jgi:hypothetical protein
MLVKMAEGELQLEGFGTDIAGTTSVVYCDNAAVLWIPYEFIGGEETATRILLHGEHSAGSRSLIATESWTMIMGMTGSAGARNWSLLASMMRHLMGPVLLVITPDVVIPTAFVGHIGRATTILFRWISDLNNQSGFAVGNLFFPLNIQAGQVVGAQRSFWKGMPLRTSDSNLGLVLNETRPQGLHLVSSIMEGGVVTLAWYRPRDSDDLLVSTRRDSLAAWLGAISDRVINLIKGDR